MYRIMLKVRKQWKCGIVDYASYEKATIRMKYLQSIGHVCKIVSLEEILH